MEEKAATVGESEEGRGERRVATGCCEEAMRWMGEKSCVKMCVGENGHVEGQLD